MTRASIRTRFRGPTNTKASRIIATDDAAFGEKPRRLTFQCDYALNLTENHVAAAQAWMDKFNPGNKIVEPGLAFASEFYWTWKEQ